MMAADDEVIGTTVRLSDILYEWVSVRMSPVHHSHINRQASGTHFLDMTVNTSLDRIDRSLCFSLLVHGIALNHRRSKHTTRMNSLLFERDRTRVSHAHERSYTERIWDVDPKIQCRSNIQHSQSVIRELHGGCERRSNVWLGSLHIS